MPCVTKAPTFDPDENTSALKSQTHNMLWLTISNKIALGGGVTKWENAC